MPYARYIMKNLKETIPCIRQKPFYPKTIDNEELLKDVNRINEFTLI
jgi:hypothetical protein